LLYNSNSSNNTRNYFIVANTRTQTLDCRSNLLPSSGESSVTK